jgi:CheY-like chemotaxis protein
MDGTRLAEFVQRQDHKLKVLYATGYVLSGNQLPPDVPESQLLRKPYNLATLSRKLAAAFRGSSERRVLLVDDEALLRADLAMALGDLGFAVDEAGTAREAMSKAEERHYGFTAALIDLGLPDQRGDDLALGLRSADSRLPIILLTGYDSEVALQKFKGDALVAYVGKPYRLHELEAALRKFDSDVALDR